jgi:hypothetical protein
MFKFLKFSTAFLFLLTINVHAAQYTVGTGSEFKFTPDQGESAALSIYITDSSFTKLGVEYFLSAGSFIKTELWQQFHLGLGQSVLTLDDGYILTAEMTKPEIMTKDFIGNHSDGVNVEDFFFSKGSAIEKFKIGIEKVEVPAGSITCTHYKRSNNGQSVDFWISDKAGDIGLVKLISKGNVNQNYKIELMSLLKNVKAKIDPLQAVPLTEKGKSFLSTKTH